MGSHEAGPRGSDPFAETDDQQALRALARDVADRDLAPNARHWDETEEFPQGSWDALRKADLFGITIDEQYGGMGMGDIEAAIVLEELARVACLSTFHFARVFTLAIGVPPHRYVSRMRLENAMAEIAAGRLSLAEVALNARFSSQASFTRAVRRATGMTPGEYRHRRHLVPAHRGAIQSRARP